MPSSAIPTAIGIGASIYQGLRAGDDSDAAYKKSMDMYRQNQAISNELKTREQELVDPNLERLIAEANGTTKSNAARLAEDELRRGIGKIRTDITSNGLSLGTGQLDAKLQTLDMNEARGIAGIRLNDEVTKDQNMMGYMQFASRVPGWATVGMGANTQLANAYEQEGRDYMGAEATAYSSVAKGLADLGKQYADYKNPYKPKTV